MGTTFPKDIMDCMKGCILSIFWPKKDIVDFMKKVGCTSRELMPESEYKELHRAEIVDKIFTNLEKRSDSGIGQFRCMLKELTEWNYFDPYYFQKLNKLSESEAKRNISHLKQLQEIRDYKIKQERQRQEEQERKRKDISISINELKEIFLNLFSGKDQNGKEINAQRRGYLFEKFLKKLFLNEGIEVTEPFKIVGEQIDGSIKYDGEHYIIEAKWHDKWSACRSVFRFLKKRIYRRINIIRCLLQSGILFFTKSKMIRFMWMISLTAVKITVGLSVKTEYQIHKSSLHSRWRFFCTQKGGAMIGSKDK